MIDSIRLDNTLLAACVAVIEIKAPCDRKHLADSACEVGLAHWTDNAVPVNMDFKVSEYATQIAIASFAYSALASFRMGMSGSASFHSVRKS